MRTRAIETIHILLDRNREGQAPSSLPEILRQLLSYLNWSFDVCIHSERLSTDLTQIEVIGKELCSFLEDHGFMRMNWVMIHPLAGSEIAKIINAYHTLYEIIQPFRDEGYKNQTESRLSLLPIIKVPSRMGEGESFFSLASFLEKRFIPAGLYVSRGPFFPFISKELRMRVERIILELKGEEEPAVKIIRSIWAHGVFDRWLDRLEETKDSEIDKVCPANIVLDERRLTLYGCWKDFVLERPVTPNRKGVQLGPEVMKVLMQKRAQEDCHACMNSALMEMGPALEVNQREHEAVRVFVARSNFLIRRGDHMKAAAFLSHAIESEKDEEKNASLCTQMGICYLNAGDAQSAFEALSRARGLGSNSGLTLYYLGLCQFHLKDYIEATDLFDQARLKDVAPEILKDLYFYKGVCHIHLEEFDEAIHSMEEAEEVGASKVPVFFYRGMGHLGKEEITKAIHFFHKALKADPTPEDQGRIIFYIGVCNKEQHRHREAIVWLQKAGDIEGPSQEIYNLMGFCHFKLKQHALAISCFEKAIEIDPKSAIDYANIGSNLRKLGRIKEAIHMYRKSLAIDPSIRFARESLIELEKMENKRTRTSFE